MKAITVESSVFTEGQPIPRKYTGDGSNVSPPLRWTAIAEAQQYALIVDDPDAPRPQPWVHWVLYAVPADVNSLPEGVPPSERVSDPGEALQGVNSWSRIGYGGPEPPQGHGVHHYHFRVFALDTAMKLAPGATKEALLKAMQGHVIGEGDLVGTYER